MGETITKLRPTLGDLRLVLAGAMAVAAAAWFGSDMLRDMRDTDREHGRDIAALRADLEGARRQAREDGAAAQVISRAERDRIEAASQQRHQMQQVEIDRLRVETGNFSAFVAATGERLLNIERMLERVVAGVTPPQVVVTPAPVLSPTGRNRLAPQPWSPPLQGR